MWGRLEIRVPVLSLNLVGGSVCCCFCCCCFGVGVGVGVGVVGLERDWSCMAKITCFNGFVFLSHKSDHLGGLFFFKGFSVENDIVFFYSCLWLWWWWCCCCCSIEMK